MSPVPDEAEPTSPEGLFARWRARLEAGETVELEAICQAHPRLAERLRALQRQQEELEQLQRRFELGIAVGLASEDHSERCIADLRPEVESDDRRSSRILGRLSSRGPASSRYRLKGEVAEGGRGAVLRIWDEDLRRHLAMKVMLSRGSPAQAGQSTGADLRSLARFLEEAQVTGQLDHPGIVPVHELGVDSRGHVYFTMKLVRGRTLSEVFDLVRDGSVDRWSQTRALGVLLKVCEAMAYAHDKGVLHRDLKPANVMVGRYGEAYVMDWGFARILGRRDEKDIRLRPADSIELSSIRSEERGSGEERADSPLHTMDGDVVGTPAYMPPEQAEGDLEAVGPRSDVYAVGAMLYHLLAGHMPYVREGEKTNNYGVWRLVKSGPPHPLSEEAPRAPAELVAICEKAMARNIEERYPDMSSLARDLEAFLEGRVVSAFETGALAEARKWVQRNRAMAASMAAGVVMLCVGLLVSMVQKDRADAKALEAQANAVEANLQRSAADARAADVLRLSALQDLEDLLAEADELWPPHPDHIAALAAWVSRAEVLAAELPRHRAKLEEIQAMALPQSEDERRLERESHPDLPRLVGMRAKEEAMRRALLQRRDGIRAALPVVDWNRRSRDALLLTSQAWLMVDPRRTRFGREGEGLVLARRALELGGDDPRQRSTILDTLAWALFASGLDEEALEVGASGLERVPDEDRQAYEQHLSELQSAVEAANSADALRSAAEEVRRLEQACEALEARIDQRRNWSFPPEHGEARWWNAQLIKLIGGLEALRDEETGLLSPAGSSPEHGWSIARRLAFARTLQESLARDGDHAVAWAKALPAIRSAYAGLDMKPQVGLLPIGPDPISGLWEFAHLMSGAPAERQADGRLLLREETGIVLVLMPGGTFWMGSQALDPGAMNHDPSARMDEGPVHQVELSPFFLSKYELTQGQWKRLTGRNPSAYGEEAVWFRDWLASGAPVTLLHPVENISWQDCMRWLPRCGLSLPSEAQWEYGARGGTHTRYWSGMTITALDGVANLSDVYGQQHGNKDWAEVEMQFDDGCTTHASVGTFRANPFGLHEVHGNLWEWCLDGFDEGFYTWGPRQDPVAPAEDAFIRVIRGGGFTALARRATCSYRDGNPPDFATYDLGVRPAGNVLR